MSWSEFLIRLYAYKRIEKNEWYKVREIAHASLVGSHLNPKKIPSKEKFMPLERKKKVKMNERMLERILKAKEVYNQQKAQNGR